MTELLSDKAKRKVTAKYPSHKIERDGAFFFIYIIKDKIKKDLGAGFSREGAYCSAACNI